VRNLNPITCYTLKGKILVLILQFLLFFISIFKYRIWKYPRVFEENPRTMTWKDLIYFAYKYYYSPPLIAEKNSDTKKRFSSFTYQYNKENNKSGNKITLSFGGDLMPYELINEKNTKHLWDEIGSDFFSHDIVFANLETPLDIEQMPSFVPEVMLNDMHFNTDETTFNIFSGNKAFKGYDVLSIANNHSLDMGKKGFLNTKKWLEKKGIKTIGVNASENEKIEQTCIIEKNGFKIGYIAFTYSLNQFKLPKDSPWLVNLLPLNTPDCDINEIIRQVNLCRDKGAEYIVCSLHCGNAYQAYPSTTTINLFEKIAKQTGVDFICGGHAHNLQPWEMIKYPCPFSGKIKQTFCVYSLGDFIAYDVFDWCHIKAYVSIELYKNENKEILTSIEVKPIYMDKKGNELRLYYLKNCLNKLSKANKVLYESLYKN